MFPGTDPETGNAALTRNRGRGGGPAGPIPAKGGALLDWGPYPPRMGPQMGSAPEGPGMEKEPG